MRCPHCGNEDPADFAYCSECGQPRQSTPASAVPIIEPDPWGGYAPGYGPPPGYGAPPAPGSPATAAPGFGPAAPPAGGIAPRLLGQEGPIEGQEFILDRPELAIGRRSDCDIVVPDDPSVSRLHARLRLLPGGAYAIEDVHSANGTWVNGVRLAPGQSQALTERDLIRIGKAAFMFRATPQSPDPVTGILDPGEDPNPFEQSIVQDAIPFDQPLVEDEPPPPPPPPRQLPPPPSEPVRAPAASDAVRAELVQLKADLGPFIERLNGLAQSVGTLESQLGHGPAPSVGLDQPLLRQLSSELQAEGGVERYRDLENLLDELRADPTDLKLLLRLSDELPTINRLVQTYVRAIGLVQQIERGP